MSSLWSNIPFRRLFAGRLVTNAGDSLYMVGAMWLVYELTGSATFTGLAGFLVQLPRVFQFLVGPLVDRWPLRPVLVYSQVLQAIFVLLVPAAAVAGHLSVWVVLAIMPTLAMLNQFVYPAQNAALPRIVTDDQLVRANSLFSMAFKSADAIFNATSGIVIAAVGSVALFVLNSATFAIAAVLFLGLTIPSQASATTPEMGEPAGDSAVVATDGSGEEPRVDRDRGQWGAWSLGLSGDYLEDLLAGMRYLRGSAVLVLVLGVMVANLAMGAMLAVLPAFADDLGGPATYGALMAAYAGGLFVGTIGANLIEKYPYGHICIAAFAWAATALVAALLTPGRTVTVALFFLAFLPVGAFSVLFWAMVQSTVDEAFIGRVTSITSSLAAVTLPIGALGGGIAGDLVGVTPVIGALAVFLAGLSAYFLVQSRLRRLPPVAEATKASLGLDRQNTAGRA